jgi:hypothetical protein
VHKTKKERVSRDKHSTLYDPFLNNKQKDLNIGSSGLYNKHTTIVNDDSNIVNRFRYSLTYAARVIIYDHQVFIVQAAGLLWLYI